MCAHTHIHVADMNVGDCCRLENHTRFLDAGIMGVVNYLARVLAITLRSSARSENVLNY